MAVTEDGDTRARRVLQRFIHQFVLTYAARRAHQSLTLLDKAFRNAPAHRRYLGAEIASPRSSPSLTPEFVLEKRRHLARKYSSSCTRPPSPQHSAQALDAVVPKSTLQETYQDQSDIHSHSSGDSEHDQHQLQHQHVTFEVVVQHLHTQLQQSRDQLLARDRRIQELETLVASLAADNRRLVHELQASCEVSAKADATIHRNDSNQIT